MKMWLTFLTVLCGLAIGSGESARLRMRKRELSSLLDAFSMLKSAVEYTAGDAAYLLYLCRDNPFVAHMPQNTDPPSAWRSAAKRFFTFTADRHFAENFMDGFGRDDLHGVLAYISLYEQKTKQRLLCAEKDVETKCRLYTVLGLCTGTAAALLLI